MGVKIRKSGKIYVQPGLRFVLASKLRPHPPIFLSGGSINKVASERLTFGRNYGHNAINATVKY